jgi:gliding motility-associated-like protein
LEQLFVYKRKKNYFWAFLHNQTQPMLKHLRLLIAILLFGLGQQAIASHISGADISVQSLGNGQYLVTLNLFRDCDGITMSTAENIEIINNCTGQSQNISAPLINPGGTNISQLCSTDSLNSTCFGGSLPGMQRYTYQVIVTMDPPCDFFNVNWETCCRNAAIVNIDAPASEDVYVEAILNLATDPVNNTPFFTAQPIPYVCNNQQVSYNYGVVETDGDSLVFSLVTALQTAGNPVGYPPPYSPTDPITGITIDPLTGQLNFTPTLLGNFVVVVQVNEYDQATGALLSTVMRDIQFVVITCSNIVPNPNAGQITNLVGSGSVIQMGPYAIELCEGSSFSFTGTFDDPNAGDTLSLTTNLLTVLPGATITTSGANPANMDVTWTAPSGSSGNAYNFIVTISDGACPVTGIQTFVYSVSVIQKTEAGPSAVITVCDGSNAAITATGGTIFTWYDMAGVQIQPGAQFSCNPCNNPIAQPTTTTSYVVISDLSGTCINIDTVTVEVVPDFTWTITVDDATPCAQQPVQLTATPNPAGNYTYNWTPPATLNDPNISNPLATIFLPGTYTFSVEMTSSQGCIKNDSISVTVANSVAPIIATTFDTACVGDTTNVFMYITNAVPNSCGVSQVPCVLTPNSVTVGNGNTLNGQTSTTEPAPYFNFYRNAKQVYLYTAAELLSMGFTGGKISALGFPVTTLNASTTTYEQYTIKMICTQINDLAQIFYAPSNLFTVFNPKPVNPAVGMNIHQFDQFYEWDGSSNLLVEICYDNLAVPYTQNCSTPYTTTPFGSTLLWFSDVTPVCADTFNTGTLNARPNTNFYFCGGAPDPADYTITWTPSNPNFDITNPFEPILLPGGPTNYTVTVVTNAGGCADTATVSVGYTTQYNVNITAADSTFCASDAPVVLTATPNGGTWSGDVTSNGGFDPAIGVGTYTATYEVGIGTFCYDSQTMTLSVSPAPDPTITTLPASFCPGDPGISLVAQSPGGSWSGPGTTPSGAFLPANAGPGTHLVIYSIPNPCPASDTVVMVVNTAPIIAAQAQAPLCITDNSVNLVATITPFGTIGTWSGPGVDNLTQTFSPSSAGTGTHTVIITATDPFSLCVSADTITITVNALPDATISTPPSTLCSGDPIFSIATVTAGGTFSGSGAVSPSGAFNPALAALGPNTVTYTVVSGGCTSQQQVTFLVTAAPAAPLVTVGTPTCEGTPNTGTLVPNPTGSINWYSDSLLTNLLNNSAILAGSISVPTTVYVTETSVEGCVSAATPVTIGFNPSPSVAITANPLTGDAPLEVSFTSVLSANVDNFLWNYGNGSATQTTDANPVYTYADSGVFKAFMIVYTSAGCTDTAYIEIDVNEYVPLLIPNIFSPNGDGQNDAFRFQINPNDLTSFNAQIFDRWGKKVVELNAVTDTWDGGNYPAGTYYWVIEATKKDGTEFKPGTGFFKMIK